MLLEEINDALQNLFPVRVVPLLKREPFELLERDLLGVVVIDPRPRRHLDRLLVLELELRRAIRPAVLGHQLLVDVLLRVLQHEDSVDVHAGDFQVLRKLLCRLQGLSNSHLLHVESDAPPRRHRVEPNLLPEGSEHKVAVANGLLQLHSSPGVDLVPSRPLSLVLKALRAVPETNGGKEAALDVVFAHLLGRLLAIFGPVEMNVLVDVSDDVQLLLQLLRRHVASGAQTSLAVFVEDGLLLKHVLHDLCGVPAGASVREVTRVHGSLDLNEEIAKIKTANPGLDDRNLKIGTVITIP